MPEDLPGPSQDVTEELYYTLVPEQGLCLAGDDIVNLKTVSVIRRLEGKTLVYSAGSSEPIILPFAAFETIRDAVFAIDDDDDEEDFEDGE